MFFVFSFPGHTQMKNAKHAMKKCKTEDALTLTLSRRERG
jgi:hypothetical protein